MAHPARQDNRVEVVSGDPCIRIMRVMEQADRVRVKATLASLLPAKVAQPIHKALDGLEAALGEVTVAVRMALEQPQDFRMLGTEEAVACLADALTTIARERRTVLAPPDSIKDLVVAEVADDVRGFWNTFQSVGYISGLIQYDKQLALQLKAAGVLVWRNDRDGQIRLVNIRWCETEEQIRAHVTDQTIVGRRCRFCTMAELPNDSLELQPVDPDHRLKWTVYNDVHKLEIGWVYTHTLCREYWLRWLDIAGQPVKRERRANG